MGIFLNVLLCVYAFHLPSQVHLYDVYCTDDFDFIDDRSVSTKLCGWRDNGVQVAYNYAAASNDCPDNYTLRILGNPTSKTISGNCFTRNDKIWISNSNTGGNVIVIHPNNFGYSSDSIYSTHNFFLCETNKLTNVTVADCNNMTIYKSITTTSTTTTTTATTATTIISQLISTTTATTATTITSQLISTTAATTAATTTSVLINTTTATTSSSTTVSNTTYWFTFKCILQRTRIHVNSTIQTVNVTIDNLKLCDLLDLNTVKYYTTKYEMELLKYKTEIKNLTYNKLFTLNKNYQAQKYASVSFGWVTASALAASLFVLLSFDLFKAIHSIYRKVKDPKNIKKIKVKQIETIEMKSKNRDPIQNNKTNKKRMHKRNSQINKIHPRYVDWKDSHKVKSQSN